MTNNLRSFSLTGERIIEIETNYGSLIANFTNPNHCHIQDKRIGHFPFVYKNHHYRLDVQLENVDGTWTPTKTKIEQCPKGVPQFIAWATKTAPKTATKAILKEIIKELDSITPELPPIEPSN